MKIDQIYLITMSLLIFHQIDAAYWKEWEMFYLPGGIQVYLLFNIGIIPVLIVGYKSVIFRSSNAGFYSYLCGGLGVLTFFIHLAFAYFGALQFSLPLSILIIALCFISGSWQVLLTKKAALP